MALVLPSTVHNPTTGVAIPASWGDAVNDAIGYIGATAPYCKATRATAQTIPTATYTAIAFTSEEDDIGGCHSTVSNNTRIVAPDAGVYRIAASVDFANNASGEIRICDILANGLFRLCAQRPHYSANHQSAMNPTCTVRMAANDYVEFRIYHDRGSDLDTATWYSAWMSIEWIRP